MANNKNHHYVPQFYFRLFTQDDSTQKPKSINMLLKENGDIKQDVSIANQASKNNFYMNKDVEKIFSDVEGKHKIILSTLNKIDSIKAYNKERENLNNVFQVVLFQYIRTLDMYKKIESLLDNYIDIFVKPSIVQDNKIKKLLEETQVTKKDLINHISIKPNNKYFLSQSIAKSFFYPKAISDLGIYILSNKTDKDFIFSDNPAIFYNLAFNKVKTNSMIALQSPGLMIFFPISTKKCLLLLDEENYSGVLINNYYFDITKETDINSINKLQIHNCTNAVYFSKNSDKKYIRKLYRQEKTKLKQNRIKNELYKNKLIVIPERINYIINLTFISSKQRSISNINYRNEELYKFMMKTDELIDKITDDIKEKNKIQK
ncbi:MAG: DUF4238 domain-containing protein [Campylobacteraceae bacterium]|nr:DUF4238 domain-containing protein [Campylobacteraceae bacterium]